MSVTSVVRPPTGPPRPGRHPHPTSSAHRVASYREPTGRLALVTGELLTITDVDVGDTGTGSEIESMFADFSSVHLRQRFLSSSRRAARSYVEALGDPDRTQVALVARLGARLVGVASAHPTEPGRAEVALAVGEGEHGTGIGTLLLEEVVRRCRLAGVTHLEATLLPGNTEVLAVLRDLGCVVTEHLDSLEVAVDIDLTRAEALSAATRRRRRQANAQVLQRATTPARVLVVTPSGARSVKGPGVNGILLVVTSASVPTLQRLARLRLDPAEVVGIVLLHDPTGPREEALLEATLRDATCPLWRAAESTWALRLLHAARAHPDTPGQGAGPLPPVHTCVVTGPDRRRGDLATRLRGWPDEGTVVVDVSPPELHAADGATFSATLGCAVTLVDRAALGQPDGPSAWALAATDPPHLIDLLDLLVDGAPTTSTLVVGTSSAGALVDRLWHQWNLRPAHLTDATQGRLRLIVPQASTGPGVLVLPASPPSDTPAPGPPTGPPPLDWRGLLTAVTEDPWVDLLVVVATPDTGFPSAEDVVGMVAGGSPPDRGPQVPGRPGPPIAAVAIVR